jgi:hypothetical protein
MALNELVEQALVLAGAQLKKDLWEPEDLKLLARRSKDLVGLYEKMKATKDKRKRRQYELAAMTVVDHIKLLALLRMQVAEKHVTEALGRFFLEKALPVLAKILVGLIAAA